MLIVVLGFIIETAVTFVVSTFKCQSVIANDIQRKLIAILMSQATGHSFAEDIAIYIVFSVDLAYELLLLSLALWAAIQCSRCFPPATRNGVRHLKDIIIEGNVLYFLA